MLKLFVVIAIVAFISLNQVSGQNTSSGVSFTSTSTPSTSPTDSNSITLSHSISQTISPTDSGTFSPIPTQLSQSGNPVSITATGTGAAVAGSGSNTNSISPTISAGSIQASIVVSVSPSGGAVGASVSSTLTTSGTGAAVGASPSNTPTLTTSVSGTGIAGASNSGTGGVASSNAINGTISSSRSGSISQSSTPSGTGLALASPSSDVKAPPPAVFSSGAPRAQCGNGVVEAGEACDSGTADPRTHCCTDLCTFLPIKSKCGDDKPGPCRVVPKCRRLRNKIVCDSGRDKPEGKKCGGFLSRKTCDASGNCS